MKRTCKIQDVNELEIQKYNEELIFLVSMSGAEILEAKTSLRKGS